MTAVRVFRDLSVAEIPKLHPSAEGECFSISVPLSESVRPHLSIPFTLALSINGEGTRVNSARWNTYIFIQVLVSDIEGYEAMSKGCPRCVCPVFTLTGLMFIMLTNPSFAWDKAKLIWIARAAVVTEVLHKDPPTSKHKSPVKPVFVTIEIKGRVVGCRGALQPRSRSLEEEIILVARAAAAHDPRYHPLSKKDLTDFKVTVTIIEATRPINDAEVLVPSDGLVLKAGEHTGIVLPWEGKDPKVRLKWAYKKAGLVEGSACQLYRMEAERFRG